MAGWSMLLRDWCYVMCSKYAGSYFGSCFWSVSVVFFKNEKLDYLNGQEQFVVSICVDLFWVVLLLVANGNWSFEMKKPT